jgi:hypothetical protein
MYYTAKLRKAFVQNRNYFEKGKQLAKINIYGRMANDLYHS